VGVIWDSVLLRPRTSRKRTVWILTEEGREVRRSKSQHLRVNEGRSVGRKKSTLRKANPGKETLFRSITPGDYGPWDPESPWPEKFWNNHLLKSKRDELTSRGRSPVREKDISPRNNFKEKDRWIESFRAKLDPSSPRIAPEEIIEGEKRRLKRLRRSMDGSKRVFVSRTPNWWNRW
jgi:hypothetical protein